MNAIEARETATNVNASAIYSIRQMQYARVINIIKSAAEKGHYEVCVAYATLKQDAKDTLEADGYKVTDLSNEGVTTVEISW